MKKWAIYWQPLERTSLERLIVMARTFADAWDDAAKQIPEDAMIIDCEPVGFGV